MRTSQPTPISPKGKQAPRFPHGWLTYLVHLDTPTMIGWTIGGRVHHESSAKKVTQSKDHWKVTHASTILALGSLTWSSYGIRVKALYKPPILASSYCIMNSTPGRRGRTCSHDQKKTQHTNHRLHNRIILYVKCIQPLHS